MEIHSCKVHNPIVFSGSKRYTNIAGYTCETMTLACSVKCMNKILYIVVRYLVNAFILNEHETKD